MQPCQKKFESDERSYSYAVMIPPSATKEKWDTVYIHSFTLPLLNRLAHLRNHEISTDHTQVRKLATVTTYATGMVLTGLCLGVPEAAIRLTASIITFPSLLHDTKSDLATFSFVAFFSAINNLAVAVTGIKSAIACFTEKSDIDVAIIVKSTSHGLLDLTQKPPQKTA